MKFSWKTLQKLLFIVIIMAIAIGCDQSNSDAYGWGDPTPTPTPTPSGGDKMQEQQEDGPNPTPTSRPTREPASPNNQSNQSSNDSKPTPVPTPTPRPTATPHVHRWENEIGVIGSNESYVCRACGATFNDYAEASAHIGRKDEPHICEATGGTKVDVETDGYKCGGCDFVCEFISEMQKHQRETFKPAHETYYGTIVENSGTTTKYKCDVCGAVMDEEEIRYHEDNVCTLKGEDSGEAGYTPTLVAETSSRSAWMCNSCDMTFDSLSDAEEHETANPGQAAHSGWSETKITVQKNVSNSWKCKKCGLIFTDGDEADWHETVYDGTAHSPTGFDVNRIDIHGDTGRYICTGCRAIRED